MSRARADDFVILCRGRADGALIETKILSRIGLTLNRTKTRICYAHSEPFDFLGYSFGGLSHFLNATRCMTTRP